MKWKQILSEIIPTIDNSRTNNCLKKKLNDIEVNDCIKKEYCLLSDPYIEKDQTDVDAIKKIYDLEISRKSNLEDKAKTNVIGITISITLIMGAYGLCNNVYSKIQELHFNMFVFFLFAVAALYMISAGISSIRTIVDENIVYTPKNEGIGLSKEDFRDELDMCIGKNRIQNLIRNNNIYTSYQYIKNALICLFVVLLISIFPMNSQQPGNSSREIYDSPYYYSESAAKYMLEHNLSGEVNTAITNYVNTIDKLQKDGVYGFINESHNLFFKIEIEQDKVTVLLIESIINDGER